MKNRQHSLFGVILLVAIFSGNAFAQETPMPTETIIETNLEDITGDSAIFYGRTVVLQGFVEYFLSANVFVLHELAAIDDDKVIVINNTGAIITERLLAGDELIIMGIAHPSRDEFVAAAESEALIYAELQIQETQEAAPFIVAATALTAIPTTPPLLADSFAVLEAPQARLSAIYEGAYPELFNSYTIIEITAIEGLARAEIDGE